MEQKLGTVLWELFCWSLYTPASKPQLNSLAHELQKTCHHHHKVEWMHTIKLTRPGHMPVDALPHRQKDPEQGLAQEDMQKASMW